MLGFLVLCGVVVNNGIVFIDYTNKLRKRHNVNSLDVAGKTRPRPILMTALTTILVFYPGTCVETGAEVPQPLAIVTIGGLVYATFLTLLVVRLCMHCLTGTAGKKPRRRRCRRYGQKL